MIIIGMRFLRFRWFLWIILIKAPALRNPSVQLKRQGTNPPTDHGRSRARCAARPQDGLAEAMADREAPRRDDHATPVRRPRKACELGDPRNVLAMSRTLSLKRGTEPAQAQRVLEELVQAGGSVSAQVRPGD